MIKIFNNRIQVLALLAALAFPAFAARRKTPSAAELMTQAREAFFAYNTELASEAISRLERLKKGYDADSLAMLGEQVERMESMIQRVEDILVIDSLTVPRNEFLAAYRLSPAAGSLLPASVLDAEMPVADATAVYATEDGSLMIWGAENGLMEARRLTDGTRESPAFLGEDLNAGGVANYPFLMPDGVTLYYACDGDDSLGGLDLYISRRSGETFPAPQNLGMPYNSPFDDYMLAIDEETGAGWWASDRNQLDSLVTIYVFIPNETRINIDVNDPDLVARARLSNLPAQWEAQSDKRNAMLGKIAAIRPAAGNVDETPDFEFVFPSGQVYTRWSDFKSPAARRLMENYVDAVADFRAEEDSLAEMRAKYRGKNATQILEAERRLRTAESKLRNMANEVIKTEMAR